MRRNKSPLKNYQPQGGIRYSFPTSKLKVVFTDTNLPAPCYALVVSLNHCSSYGLHIEIVTGN